MTLKDFCKDKVANMLLKFASLLLIVSVIFSVNIYLKKLHASQEHDLRQLALIKAKINRLNELKLSIDKLSIKEIQNSELKLAQLLDKLSTDFPDLKIELSPQKIENEAIFFPFVIRGERSFNRFLQALDFLNNFDYPICFITSVSLKSNEKFINFEIKGEIGLLK